MDRNIDNEKYLMCVVTYIDGPMKTFEEDKIIKDLDEGESKNILKKKRLELTLMVYIDREDKIK